MPREENLLILKMLQEGTISAEQAAELISAIDAPVEAAEASAVPPVPPATPVPPTPPTAPSSEAEGEVFARARARIAAAREKVAGVQEKLTAAEERMGKAEGAANPWDAVADALKDVPGARSISEAMRGVDPGRIAANARRQARRVGRQVRASFDELNLDLPTLTQQMQGEPTVSVPHEATATLASGATLRVRNSLGDIEVVGADVPDVRAAGVLKIWAGDEQTAQATAAQISLSVEQGTDGPTISVVRPEKLRRAVLDVKVFVPQNTPAKVSLLSPSGDVTARNLKGGAVILATQAGDAIVQEVAGDVAVETASGDIEASGIIGSLHLAAASGDITAMRVSGQSFKATTQSGDIDASHLTVPVVQIETVSGDIELIENTGRVVRVRSVSGDVASKNCIWDEETHLDTVSGSLELAPKESLTKGSVTLSTVSGDISLTLPERTDGSLDFRTKSGDVKGNFKGEDGAEKSVKGSGMVTLSETVGSGSGAKIALSSVSGDVTVEQTDLAQVVKDAG